MQKSWFLIFLPLVFLISGCSFNNQARDAIVVNPVTLPEGTTCAVPLATTTLASTSTSKNILPPVSQEEKRKTFTFEDEEMGVKLQYPGSCFFNKGIFQCSDFTLSIWVLDSVAKPSSTPAITYKDGQTEVKYVYINNNKVYALMAWYDGENRSDLNLLIDKIAKSLTFIK